MKNVTKNTKQPKAVKQEIASNIVNTIGNNYKTFFDVCRDLSNNSIGAKANEIWIHIDLNENPEQEFSSLIDNGRSVKNTTQGLKKFTKFGKTLIEKKEEVASNKSNVHEHGVGAKAAIAAVGNSKSILFFENKVDTVAKIFKMEDLKYFPDLKFPKKEALEELTFMNPFHSFGKNFKGTAILMQALREDNTRGVSLFNEDKVIQKDKINRFIDNLKKTYLFLFQSKKLKINISICENGELILKETLGEEVYLPGETIIKNTLKYTCPTNGKYKIEFDMRRVKLEEGRETPFDQDLEERRFIYLNDILIDLPPATSKDYGTCYKDGDYAETRLFIRILKGKVNTMTSKNGLNTDSNEFKIMMKLQSDFINVSSRPLTYKGKWNTNTNLNVFMKSLKSENFKNAHNEVVERTRQLFFDFGEETNIYDNSKEILNEFDYKTASGQRPDLQMIDNKHKIFRLFEIKSKGFDIKALNQGKSYMFASIYESTGLANKLASGYHKELVFVVETIKKSDLDIIEKHNNEGYPFKFVLTTISEYEKEYKKD